MIGWIIAVAILTPWFWSWHFPKDLLDINLTRDVEESRMIVNWERGKTANISINFLFANWPKEFLKLRLGVLMENLDIGNYFFAGHPRERVDVEEKQKFFFFQFILFGLGFANPLVKKYAKFLIICTISVLLGSLIFTWRTFEETTLFAIPLVVVMALGLKSIFSLPKKWIFVFCCLAILEIVAFMIFKTKGLMQ